MPFKDIKNLPNELVDEPEEIKAIVEQTCANFLPIGKTTFTVNSSKTRQRGRGLLKEF